ncbi:hypothetical protein ACW2QC_03930 [Virgibacillus sp. FSP13]
MMEPQEELKSQQITKLYMPDTNCFRYKAYVIHSTNSDSEKDRRRNKEAAIRFWNKIILESDAQKSKILVSSEVAHELKVQSYTLNNKENNNINKLISALDIETAEVPQDVEFLLREFSNYARKNYGSLLTPPGLKMDYLRASDARIFVHSYLNDGILTTANIKDFLLYPLFFGHTEQKLYNILSSQFITTPLASREIVEQDIMFQNLLYKMRDLKY